MVLVSPDFLFPARSGAARAAPIPCRMSSSRRACRFLWSSIPTTNCSTRRSVEKLHEPAVLDRQVRRMLGDKRARTALARTSSSWLQTRNVRLITGSQPEVPWFDDNLRVAFVKEMELFVDAQLKEDHSIVDLLTSNQTFLNEQLARHYGVPGLRSHFRPSRSPMRTVSACSAKPPFCR